MTTAVLEGSWESLKKIAVRQVYPARTVLFQQGDPVSQVSLIEGGVVWLLRWENENKPVAFAWRRRDWILGAMSAFLSEPQIATAETITACALWTAPTTLFMELLATDLTFHATVHRMHLREMADQTRQLAGLGSLSAEERLRRLLWEFCEAQDDRRSTAIGVRLNLPFKQEQLADLISASREHLNRLLKVLEDQHLIRRNKGWIIVPDPARLRPSSDVPRRF